MISVAPVAWERGLRWKYDQSLLNSPFAGNAKIFLIIGGIPREDDVFVAEDLTGRRSNFLYHARQLGRDQKIKYCWTRDGNVFVKPLPPSNGQDQKPAKIKSLHDLQNFGS